MTYLITVDGKWREWGNWDTCSETCGGGIQNRTRLCDPPQYDGANCPRNVTLLEHFQKRPQEQSQNQTCNAQDCPSKWCQGFY